MKNLLQKSLKPLTIFAFIVFLVSIPIYFLLVDWIWMKELDENNELIAQRIENEFNEQKISEEKLQESITFWNEIQSVGKIEPRATSLKKNSVYTIRRQNPYSSTKAIDRFRGLTTTININNQHFMLTIETNVEESEETVAYIAAVTLLFFLILVIGFWILNKRLSKKLWQPFQNTLKQLKAFQLNKQTELRFDETDIIEFQELNTALDKLLRHSIATYKHQKEFTENASHELQTPLAIIKHKLDLLLQKEPVTQRQYQLIEEIHTTLTRITRINKNLLLLAKIENQQFSDTETIDFSLLVRDCTTQLEEHFHNKQIHLQTHIENGVTREGNKTLCELLINNLLLNAIRHSDSMSVVEVHVSQNGMTMLNSGSTALDNTTIFNRFTRHSEEQSGSGLGLAIIQQICNRHNWTIHYTFQDGFHSFSVSWS